MKKKENKELSLRAEGVTISCDKALSLRGGRMSDEAIFQAETNSVQRLLSRRCKNVEDCHVGVSRLLAMTIPTLAFAAVLSMGLISESWAAEILPQSGECGSGCSYEIIDNSDGTQNLRVYNTPGYNQGTIADNAFTSSYDSNGTHYNYYDNAQFNKIIIDGDFDKIGKYAFLHNNAGEVVFNGNIKTIGYGAFEHNNFASVNLPQGVTEIQGEAFYHSQIRSVVIPDSVTSVGSYAFAENSYLTTVNISDTLDALGGYINGKFYTFYPFGKNSNLAIICKGDLKKCQSLVKEYHLNDSATTTDLSDKIHPATKEQCIGDKYFWNGTSCSRKEAYCDNNMYYTGIECLMRPEDSNDIVCEHTISGYVKIGDNCVSPENSYAKKRYTPAEANRWLYDEDNEIIMTFKVNR